MLLAAAHSCPFIRSFWGFFCNYTQIFHTKYPRHFRPNASPVLQASRFRMWELRRRPAKPPSPPPPPLIYCHIQTKESKPITVRETLRRGGRQDTTVTGFEVAQVHCGEWETQRLARHGSSPVSVAPTSLSSTLGFK